MRVVASRPGQEEAVAERRCPPAALGLPLCWAVLTVAVGLLVLLPGPATLDPDEHAAVVYFDRLVAADRLEEPLSSPKPLLDGRPRARLAARPRLAAAGGARRRRLRPRRRLPGQGGRSPGRPARRGRHHPRRRRFGPPGAPGRPGQLDGVRPGRLGGRPRRPDQGRRARVGAGGGALAVAGLARAESWLLLPLAAAYGLVAWRRGDRRALSVLPLAAPLLWLAHDWLLTGDPLRGAVPGRYTDPCPAARWSPWATGWPWSPALRGRPAPARSGAAASTLSGWSGTAPGFGWPRWARPGQSPPSWACRPGRAPTLWRYFSTPPTSPSGWPPPSAPPPWPAGPPGAWPAGRGPPGWPPGPGRCCWLGWPAGRWLRPTAWSTRPSTATPRLSANTATAIAVLAPVAAEPGAVLVVGTAAGPGRRRARLAPRTGPGPVRGRPGGPPRPRPGRQRRRVPRRRRRPTPERFTPLDHHPDPGRGGGPDAPADRPRRGLYVHRVAGSGEEGWHRPHVPSRPVGHSPTALIRRSSIGRAGRC